MNLSVHASVPYNHQFFKSPSTIVSKKEEPREKNANFAEILNEKLKQAERCR
ncbi:hypothetical protein [Paenibacillus physcomitrellae]|uniref:Uncharacterized protein n=1 Tax=Paenibacillus physcomitrellae TaxID=1619311 RepID=A0ABQ1FRY6_9BACL|nr:hypothetical protein [Paenibacillus physcomitrellae]GGA28004.1 hypothetical protein GCM10010917_11180 [Paenibacillus physcomitrellae]